MKSKIIIINRYLFYKRGGGEINDLNLGRSLSRDVDLCYLTQFDLGQDDEIDFAEVVNVNAPYFYEFSWKFPGYLGKLLRHVDELIFFYAAVRLLKNCEADKVMITGRQIYLPFWFLKRRRKKLKIIATVRGYISKNYQKTLKKFDAVIYWGGSEEDLLEPTVDNSLMLWPAIDKKTIGSITNGGHQQTANRGLEVVFIGRLEPIKNVEFLIEAVKEVSKEIDISLSIIGTGSLLPILKKRCKDNQNIKFKGFIANEDLQESLDQNSIVCLSSKSENCPIVFLEAIYLGMPFIGPAVGRIPRLVERSEGGLMYELGDKNGLIESLRVMSRNPSIYKPKNASFIKSWDETGDQVLKFLESF